MKSLNPKENILIILLKSTVYLCMIASFISVSFFIKAKIFDNTTYVGDNPANVIVGTIFFLGLYFKAQKDRVPWTGFIFILSLVVIGIYCSIKWGADVPIALLHYILAIIFSGLLISGSSAILLNLFILVCLFIVIILQGNRFIKYDYSWVQREIEVIDGFVIGIILSIISLVSWISNREIEKSLNRAIKSEEMLRIERDNLEKIVEKKTIQLFNTQADKITQMYKFAEFGKLAAGLVHELVNPLASVSLNLEQLNSINDEKFNKIQLKKILSRATLGTKTMEEYIRAARRQIQNHVEKSKFSINKSIYQSIRMFDYRFKTEGIKIKVIIDKQTFIIGNSIHFHHIINNLIGNSIDSFQSYEHKDKQIIINVEKLSSEVVVKVFDNGKGINSKIADRIFAPFFTTKKQRGTGLGLSLTKELIQNSFAGTIELENSQRGKTIFIVKIPIV